MTSAPNRPTAIWASRATSISPAWHGSPRTSPSRARCPRFKSSTAAARKFLGTQPIKAPSAIPWPKLWDQYGTQAVPQVLTIDEIQDIVHAFGDAALARENCWLQARRDPRRPRLPAHELLLAHPRTTAPTFTAAAWRTACASTWRSSATCARKVGPDFPVTIRLSGTDYEPDGFPIEETVEAGLRARARGASTRSIFPAATTTP